MTLFTENCQSNQSHPFLQSTAAGRLAGHSSTSLQPHDPHTILYSLVDDRRKSQPAKIIIKMNSGDEAGIACQDWRVLQDELK